MLNPKIKFRATGRMHCLLVFTTKFPMYVRQQGSLFKIRNQVQSHVLGEGDYPHRKIKTSISSSACSAGGPGSIPGSGRSPGEGNGNPLQYSCLETPMDRGAWRATVHGVTRVGHNLAPKSPPPSYVCLTGGPGYGEGPVTHPYSQILNPLRARHRCQGFSNYLAGNARLHC